MKKIMYHMMIIVVALLGDADLYGFGKRTIFGIRSQGLNEVLELAGWQKSMFKYDQNRNFGVFSGIVKYDHSFRSDKIAEFLFGSEHVRFRGSRSVDRRATDIMADYFGLPIDFASNVCFSPFISNVTIDFNLFQSFDGTVPGLFCMVHVPIVHTKWSLAMKENVVSQSTGFYPAGYMGDSRISSSSLPQSVTQALMGSTTFGDMQDPLMYGKIMGRQERSRVAELQATIGWNYNKPWYHAGLSFRVGAPTGNATNAQFLFEEIVGNRHHWDIGVGFSGHSLLWNNHKSGRSLALYIDAHISHLCSSQQKRSFDLINNGPGSRYMLLEEMVYSSTDLLINAQPSTNQYIRTLMPVINQTTFDTKISIGVQADIVVKLAYQHDGLELDCGYNFWANSREKLHCRSILLPNRFALKGDGQLYGFAQSDDSVIIPLNGTQNQATIFGGQNVGNSNFQNLNADNQPAIASTEAGIPLVQLNNADAAALTIPRVVVRGSNPPIFLNDRDINNESGLLPRAISHKFFLFANYIWNNRDDVDPYAGFGVSVETAHTNACSNSAYSQWAVWLKTGFAY